MGGVSQTSGLQMMDSFELSKIAGAVLSALLVIVGAKTIIDLNKAGHGVDDDVVGYVLEVEESDAAEPAASAQAATTEAPAQFDAAKVVAMVGALKASDGESLFKKCRGCHNSAKGEPAKAGPNLWGIVDRPKGGVEGFGYSSAMSGKGGAWTLEDLAAFLHKPKEFVPGTKMIFKGFKKDGDLAKILAYLDSLK